ncbi:MAG: nucleoside phosphorylase [Campylobacteraceae bacterium]|jgi:hypothetical protein|nr:nucleoside phosphorylase [Campylobacteraceae bacterium]
MKTKIKTLIHTALVAEAKPLIGYFHLKCIAKIPFNIYKNDDIALIVSGIGGEKTEAAILYALSLYEPKTAINIGCAGCADTSVKIGSLFCTTHADLPLPYASLSSHEHPVSSSEGLNSLLADQEGEAFLRTVPSSVEKYIFKVVSDHLNPTLFSKETLSSLMQKSLPLWSVYAK